tara:strand:- start:190 stop:648 length:459 start_codon:yes stop_codon:yes gene_type:complete
MINIKNNRLYFILLSIFIIISDQVTKNIINLNYKSFTNNDFVLFRFDYVKNYGAAFNLLNGNRIFLSILSTSISIILLYFILNNKKKSNIELLSYSFILGGTIGNGIDRIIKGYVIDFINLNFINFPVFNIADISINIGLLFIIYGFIKYNR